MITSALTLSFMAAEITWHVGDVVRKLRMARGLTQKDLAGKAGLHHNTIVRLEDGDEGVMGRTLKKVALALGVNSQFLWAAVPSERTIEPPERSHQHVGEHSNASEQ